MPVIWFMVREHSKTIELLSRQYISPPLRRPPQRALVVAVGFIICLFVATLGLVSQQYSQAHRNNALLKAIKEADEPTCITLIAAGAKGNAVQDPSATSWLRFVLARIERTLNISRRDLQENPVGQYALVLYFDTRPFGDEELPLALLKTGANASAHCHNAHDSSLVWNAATRHQHQVVRALVAGGADVSTVLGDYPLPDPQDLQTVLDHGADPNQPSFDGSKGTPLFGADLTQTEILIAHGAKPNVRNIERDCPLNLAIDRNEGSFRCVTALLRAGATDESKNVYGETALLIACHRGSLETVQALVKKGSSLTARDNVGSTALMRSTANNDPRVLSWLIARGVNLNDRDSHGNTALGIITEVLHDRNTWADENDVPSAQLLQYAEKLRKAGGITKDSRDGWYGFHPE